MDVKAGDCREVVVPVSVFAALRRELAEQPGPLRTIQALHAAGYAAGLEAAAGFPASAGEDVGAIREDAFWERVTTFFSRRGWGTLSRDGSSEVVGMLTSDDWVESAEVPDGAAGHVSCSFSTGFLSGFLSRLSGGRMAVLEVTCRGRGDGRCTFAFGSESAVHELYGRLLEGSGLQQALADL
ncbi:MAG: hypothetical protein LJF06_14350 [Gemmatimonadetes bacterium]|nr:hypothetical protein [Gemmatimonadota bacterium]